MFGSLTLLLPVLGIALGIGAAVNADGTFLPPTVGWVIALIVLGIADSMAAAIGGTAYFAVTVMIGGMPTKAGAQSTLGLIALWFAPVLIAASARPLRRLKAADWMARWDRGADFVIGPLFGMWGAQGMVFAQNGLSGRKLPLTASVGLIGLIVFCCLAARFCLESLVASVYPRRLEATNSGDPGDTTMFQKAMSLACGVTLFALVGRSFFPMVWQFWFSVGLFGFGTLVGWDRVREPLPNVGFVYRYLPTGLVKTVLMIFVGRQAERALEHWQHDPTKRVLDGMVYLALPGLALMVLGMLGRDGERPEPRWWHRIGGVALLAVLLHVRLGWFAWMKWL